MAFCRSWPWREKIFMLDQDQIAKWIIGLAADDRSDARTAEFLEATRLGWPRVLAHARRELSGRQLNATEISSLALEIWESLGDDRPAGRLSAEQRAELARRDAELEANPGIALSWEQIRAGVEGRE